MLRLFKALITFRRIFHIQPLKILIKLPARVNEPPRRVNNNVYNIFMTPLERACRDSSWLMRSAAEKRTQIPAADDDKSQIAPDSVPSHSFCSLSPY